MKRIGGTVDRTVVVVGNGMVGHSFCERLVGRDPASARRLVVFGEEPRAAYDRVHLSELFAGRSAADLTLGGMDFYRARSIVLHTGERVVNVDRDARVVVTDAGRRVPYDVLVLATGSAPFVPPIAGIDLPGVFVYRTIGDVDAIRAWAGASRSAAVIGGGLLGLEAAKAARDLGLETHVVEFAPRLMPRQVDAAGGAILRDAIEALGIRVHVAAQTEAVLGASAVTGLALTGGETLAVDMVIVSAGIRPRDELARTAGLAVGPRGGIVVNDALQTTDPAIYCIGESALHRDTIYGLVAPGYAMADAVAAQLCGEDATFTGADMSTKLKLLGVDVASFGDAFADERGDGRTRAVVYADRVRGVYQKLVVASDDRRLVGGILVGDADRYTALVAAMRDGGAAPERPHELLFGASAGAGGIEELSDGGQICSCNNVTKGAIREAIGANGCTTVAEVKACTRAGTGCGGCVPFVTQLLDATLAAAGRAPNRDLCEHFPYSRQDLFQIVKIGRIRTFEALLVARGRGDGCEICRPAVASILASTWSDFILEQPTIQDTNDRFLANVQRGGTYSVVPRIPGGEITPDKLIVLGEVAKRFGLYVKITGGQRIDLLGARVDQLPEIWEALVGAGFESGHAYGKAMRTVKSCVGTTWCRYGVQDSTALAIRLEERYRGIRAPHKLKSAVSGCIRECAEAQSKDFGVIATEKGWNLYLCGNGGSQPRHADLFVSDVDDDTVVRLLDRFLMYYIHTANPLERTARWLERFPGGIEQVRRVIVDDALGICADLERDMATLVSSYECEWAAVVRDPERRRAFRAVVNVPDAVPSLGWVEERGQRRPADWSPPPPSPAATPDDEVEWIRVAGVGDVPRDGGVTYRHGALDVAVFHFAARNAWYATEATCPHRGDAVLGRGLLGSHCGIPKVACPLHKRTFSLESGDGLSDPAYRVRTFPVEVRGDAVWVRLPRPSEHQTEGESSPMHDDDVDRSGSTAGLSRRAFLHGVGTTGLLLAGLGGGLPTRPARAAAALEKTDLRFGFIKLTDCAPLVIAKERGFFEDEGLYVTLEAQANWKILLDRVIGRELDGAHMLAGQPLGASVGFGTKANVITAFSMDLNGNGITVSNDLWEKMKANDPSLAGPKPVRPVKADALVPVVKEYAAAGTPLKFGMVFPLSTHNYELRYWLAAAGISPGFYTPTDTTGTTDAQVLLSVTPPPQMPPTLAQGTIQGYCVGEPWNQQAVFRGIGVPVITDYEIWRNNPEKVFGVTAEWNDENPRTHVAVVKALIRAGKWLDASPENRKEACRILARPEYVGADYEVIANSMTGTFEYERGDKRDLPDFNVFFRYFATYPYYSDAVWYLTQMRRWGQIPEAKPDAWYAETARRVYRPDVYRQAAEALIAQGLLGASEVPTTDGYKAPDANFIDGIEYDGRSPNAYLAKLHVGLKA